MMCVAYVMDMIWQCVRVYSTLPIFGVGGGEYIVYGMGETLKLVMCIRKDKTALERLITLLMECAFER